MHLHFTRDVRLDAVSVIGLDVSRPFHGDLIILVLPRHDRLDGDAVLRRHRMGLLTLDGLGFAAVRDQEHDQGPDNQDDAAPAPTR